jgi:hypothetical protein
MKDEVSHSTQKLKLSQPWGNFEGVEAFSTLGKL